MRNLILPFVIAAVTGGAAWAACPATAPDPARFATQPGDQKVNAAWLQQTLAGNKLAFPAGGTEIYHADGRYSYQQDGQTFDAPSYRFYDSGMRCIDYPSPRFDLYVVHDKTLVLINGQGGRFGGKLTQ